MRYKYEDKLRAKAEEFSRALGERSIPSCLLDDSIRDFSVKLSIGDEGADSGKVNLYYSPRSDSFTLVTQELNDKLAVPILEECWRSLQAATRSDDTGIQIYVDGSYLNGATGYGAVVLKDGKVIDELSGAVTDATVAYARQVAGELFAVEEALRWCVKNSIRDVAIFYDYYGVEKWATGRWKANQPLTQAYRQFVRDSRVNVSWRKVAAHSGNRWNDRADQLAKKGALSASQPAPATAAADDRMSDLIEKVEGFIEFLMVRGVEAWLDGTYNDQFARLLIVEQDKRVGIFDLYNTKNKPLSPYLHAFKDDEIKSKIEAFWREHKDGMKAGA